MKTLVLFICLMIFPLTYAQTNATDVTITDCDGITHNLFDELDAGKIIVVGWTMPCASCIAPLLDVHNVVLNFEISNPGVVEYWVNDDFGNSTCANVEGWCTTNGITNATYFSDADLLMTDYGTAGMPKVVVLGCTDHKVYYNKNDNPYGPHVGGAIQTALSDLEANCQLGVEEVANPLSVKCYPNPATEELNVKIEADFTGEVSFEILGINGITYNIIEITEVSDGDMKINTSGLSSGFYLLKVKFDSYETIRKFQIL